MCCRCKREVTVFMADVPGTEVDIGLNMPPAPSVSSTEPDEEVAFQVLNQDNLPLTIIGHPILKPFDLEAQKAKPNLIVHPTRRMTNNLEENKQKPFTKSSGNINNYQYNDRISRKNISSSHGNLCHNNSMDQAKMNELIDQLDIEKFSKTLDSKLKRLQKEENRQQKKSNCDTANSKKPFVTTVKKGQFLEPPPEIASLMGIKVEEQKYVKKNSKLYAFASHPRVLSRTPPKKVHQTRCEAAARAAAKLVGTVIGIRHEEHLNSRNSTTHQPYPKRFHKDKTALSTLDDQVDPNLAASRLEQAKRRAVARKKAKHQQSIRPKRSVNSSFTSDILRDRLLDITEFQRLLVATEKNDAATQTEKIYVQENDNLKDCKNVQIQVHPTDLFDFNIEVQPIIEILVSKTIEEALIEVLEEEELLAMKEQQRKFLEYMAQKAGDYSKMDDEVEINEEMFSNMSSVVKRDYVPNLITSV